MAKQKEKRISAVRINGVDWTVEKVKESILTNDQAVKNALLRLYSWQTEEEKASQETRENNGKGFNGTDGRILSSFAEQLKSKGWLSPKQIALSRKKLVKYARQIFDTCIAAPREETYKKFGI
jgi:hypothetical protein